MAIEGFTTGGERKKGGNKNKEYREKGELKLGMLREVL